MVRGRMRLPIVVVAVCATACLTPRSMMQGQMAAPIGRGAAEIGVGTGIGYAQQETTRPGTTNETTAARIWTVPAVERNAPFGLTERLALNAHFSPAGIQPGLKITVNRPRAAAHFALLPQFALGYGHVRSAANVTDSSGIKVESSPQSTSLFTFMLGLRLMVSHKSGFFTGVGGDFIATRSVNTVVVSNANVSSMPGPAKAPSGRCTDTSHSEKRSARARSPSVSRVGT